MLLWKPKRKKTYPHFDRLLSDQKIVEIVMDESQVATNKFFPFILFVKKFKRYDKDTPRNKRVPKDRKIRYACRRDAYIFEYYRGLLSPLYEDALAKSGISEIPIAYRRMKSPLGKGKSSIEFAKDAFWEIATRRPCFAVTLDISKYFEHLDHAQIYRAWASLLGKKKLPKDHLAVFKAITKYTEVDRDQVYERLGIIGPLPDKPKRKGFLKKAAEIPYQLCSPKEFREKICGVGGKFPKLLVQNDKPYGIPQGAPISDLIANFYLLNFDEVVAAYCKQNGIYYRRYCDDILLVIPEDKNLLDAAVAFLKQELHKAGSRLEIKQSKTKVHHFSPAAVECLFADGGKHPPFEYLGFQFDGNAARLRSGTMSSFYRKVTYAVRSEARHLAKRYSDKDAAQIFDQLNLSQLYEKFGRKRDFENFVKDKKKWNFWSYITRAAVSMGDAGKGIHKQMRNYKKFVRTHLRNELAKAVSKRDSGY
jgi:hypothetical protein